MNAVYSFVIIICVLTLFRIKSEAQEYYEASARSKSLAGISSCLSDSWSVFGNQAGVSETDYPVLGISYSNYFLLKELSLKSAFAAVPIDGNVFGVSFYQYGYDSYNENKFGIAFAKEIIPGFSAGFQFNYFFIHFPENEKSQGDYSIEGGLQYKLSEKIMLGVHCFNPFQSGIKTESYKYKLPCLFRLGAGTRITDELWLYYEFEMNLKSDFQNKFGIEYQISNAFQLRGGLAGKNNLVAFGVAYTIKQFTTDFSWQYNYKLGSTPSVSISYHLK